MTFKFFLFILLANVNLIMFCAERKERNHEYKELSNNLFKNKDEIFDALRTIIISAGSAAIIKKFLVKNIEEVSTVISKNGNKSIETISKNQVTKFSERGIYITLAILFFNAINILYPKEYRKLDRLLFTGLGSCLGAASVSQW